MSPLYNPDDLEESTGGAVEAGEYFFKVESCDGHESQAGNSGMKLKLTVRVEDDRDISVYDYLMFTKKALWKMRDFCNSVGIDFYGQNDLEPKDYLGMVGRANFELGEENEAGRRYLGVDGYIPQNEQTAPEKPVEKPVEKAKKTSGNPF